MTTPYDFTTVIDRSAIGSEKWLGMAKANPDVPAGISPLSVADLDMRNAPEIIDGLKEFLGHAVLGYSKPTADYLDAVAGWMERRHGWQVERDWIQPSSGVVPAIFNAVRVFTEPGDGVIIHTPAYYPFYMAIERNDRVLAANPLLIDDGDYRIDFDGLDRLAKDPANKLLVLCNPHNPTGRVFSRHELEKIARIAIEHDLVVVSDEIHFDLVMPGHQHTVFATLGEQTAQRTLVCTAPSKTFNLAGMSTSNIIIPNGDLRRRFVTGQERDGGFVMLTTLGYKACELAYTRGEPWLAGLLELVSRNHQVVKEHFARHFPQLRVFPLEGTYLQWIDFRPLGIDADQLERRNTHDALCFFDEGKIFGSDGVGFERMNLATPTHEIEAALARLTDVYGSGSR